MKKYILVLVGMLCVVAGMAITPVKEGNIITGHVIVKGIGRRFTLCYRIDC